MTEVQSVTPASFPIVGIGASAGGLEAFEAFFNACPADTGMAFVLVSHLPPEHHSLLAEILQRSTNMPVNQVVDQDKVVPNHVYIIQPNCDMSILNGVLQLSKTTAERGQHLPIDIFFRSLAEDKADKSIGIILSGTASDGVLGLRAIHDAGGVCMVQTPATAKYDGMPQSAIHSGYVTNILNVEVMPEMLQKISRQSGPRLNASALVTPDTLNGMSQILQQIRNSTGHDFSLYKKSTIGRRIERRMTMNHIQDIEVYAHFLKQNSKEIQSLFSDILINVTGFFRDKEAFIILKRDILPALIADKPDDYTFRVWVAGCSSGEEAYSIAIILRELMDDMHKKFKVQIFATDLDDDVISRARSGSYPIYIAQDIGPERLQRFFTLDEHGYKIKKEIRQMVVFAVQSVIKDPPFIRLDLLSCRNLMIYLEQEQQERLIPIFNFALKPGGVLFLSNSESITDHTNLFKPLNRKWKFYQAQKSEAKPRLILSENLTMTNKDNLESQKIAPRNVPAHNIATLTNRILLQSYAPASVTTDAKGNILYVHGDTSSFLSTPSGPVTTNVMDMAHTGLQSALRTAVQSALQGEPSTGNDVVMHTKQGERRVSFSVRRLTQPISEDSDDEILLLVSFKEEAGRPVPKRKRGKSASASEEHQRIEQLERELILARENQQSTIEEMQATNEELKSSNEELQSTNEELQSSNEELETSKEELQSLNEETITVNSELNTKVEQLSISKNDLNNLMENVNTGIVFLDYELKIRRYTKEAVKVYRLIPTDLGRPLSDITTNLQDGNLLPELQTVLKTLIPQEMEVKTTDGIYYLARIQPYRTSDQVIEGVVISLTNIDALRKTTIKLAELELMLQLTDGIVDTVVEPLVVLDSDLKVVRASRAFFQYFKVTVEQTIGHKIYELGNGQWNIPTLRAMLEDILPQHQTIEGFVVEHDFPDLGKRRMELNARRIKSSLGYTELILLTMANID